MDAERREPRALLQPSLQPGGQAAEVAAALHAAPHVQQAAEGEGGEKRSET